MLFETATYRAFVAVVSQSQALNYFRRHLIVCDKMKEIVFEDKIAIVTGAAQGIGRGIALMLAESGAKVAVVDISDKIDLVVTAVPASATLDVIKQFTGNPPPTRG